MNSGKMVFYVIVEFKPDTPNSNISDNVPKTWYMCVGLVFLNFWHEYNMGGLCDFWYGYGWPFCNFGMDMGGPFEIFGMDMGAFFAISRYGYVWAAF